MSAGDSSWLPTSAVLLCAAAVFVGCAQDAPQDQASGRLSGQVVVSGPLRNAKVSIDQLEYTAKAVSVRTHLGDTTTDEHGLFAVETADYSGLLLVTVRGGSFVDLATQAVVVLDPDVGLESIEPLGLLERRDDALVSPFGHLIAARTRAKAAELGDVVKANQDAEDRLGRLFGNVPWTRVQLASLDDPATSPTAPVRAAFVQAAWSFLVHDIAEAASASPQEVHVLALTHQLVTDIADARFDGDDNDAIGGGLQLGVCPLPAGCDGSPPAPGACPNAACRPLCDLYSGTPRALLAGEITKVVNSPLNKTGLATADLLAVARAVADDSDEELFGPGAQACMDQLDRIPPTITWVDPTPAALAYKRGSFTARAVATDDTDANPRVQILGSPESAGAAMATIDTTQMPDGPLTLKAAAHDMAGNTSMTQRTVQVDNTVPQLTIDGIEGADVFIDVQPSGTTWWTTVDKPTLRGTVSDAAPVTVATTIPGGNADATVTGTTWTGTTSDPLDMGGTDVVVAATDAAGNRTGVSQRIRPDLTRPRLTFDPSVVNDEALDVPTFDPSTEAPIHIHTGATIDLAATGACSVVTKFSYLLGSTLPAYGSEVDNHNTPRRNPLHYLLLTSDDGVGVATGSTQYRVGFRNGNTTTWLLDWTTAGAPSAVAPGVDRYDIGIFSDAIPQLATTEGIYDVEFRATDKLARTTTEARCFELHLRASPLHFQQPGSAGDLIPADHPYRLLSLDVANQAPFRSIAARVLNDDATGASVLDEDVTNGTASTVYLDVVAPKPGRVFIGQQFQMSNVSSTRSVTIDCTDDPDHPPPAICFQPTPGPFYTSNAPGNNADDNQRFHVKVFELDANLAPANELPCIVCDVATHWKFAIPPRSGTAGAAQPARRFKVMTMLGQISLLWPRDDGHPAMPPFRDTSLNGKTFTGVVDATSEGCVVHETHQLPDGTLKDTCTRVTKVTPYRALIAVHLQIIDQVSSIYSTAPTQAAVPVQVVTIQQLIPSWDKTRPDGTLP